MPKESFTAAIHQKNNQTNQRNNGEKKNQKQEPTSHPFLPHNLKFLDIINLHPGSNISQTNHVTLEGQEESKTISYVIVTKT